MSHLKYHYKINKVAYQVLKQKLGKKYFPSFAEMFVYTTVLSPDVIHVFKHIYGYETYNHLNTKKHPQALDFAIKHYDKLVKKLKLNRGALNAAWLGHFIVDSLEPMHLFEWKVENKKNRRKKLMIHASIEDSMKNLRIISSEIIQIKSSVEEFIKKQSNEIKKLNIQDYYPDKNKIIKIYEKKIIPMQVQAVASIWYKAVCDSNELQ